MTQLGVWVEDAFTERPRPANLIFICALPLYHIFALTVNALMGMQMGARNVLIPNPRDIPGFVKELAKYRFHKLPGLNTLFNALLNNEDFRKLEDKVALSNARSDARLNSADTSSGKALDDKLAALDHGPSVEDRLEALKKQINANTPAQ